MACSSCNQKKQLRESGGKLTTKKVNRSIVTTHSKFGKFTVRPTGGKYSYGRVKR